MHTVKNYLLTALLVLAVMVSGAVPVVAGPTAPSLQAFDAVGACSERASVVLVSAETVDSEPLPEAFDLFADDVRIATPDPADVLVSSELVGAEYVATFEFTVALEPGTYQVKLTVFGLFGTTSSDAVEVRVPSDCTPPEEGDPVLVNELTPYTVWVDINGEEVDGPTSAAVKYTRIDDRGVEVSTTIDDNVDFIVVASDTDYLVDLDLPVGWNEVACDDVVDRPELDGFDHNFGTGTFPSGTRPIIHTVCGQQDAPDGFSDVPSGHPFVTEIGWLVGEGITTGFPDGTFRPTVAVSRQAAAAFLYRLAGEPEVTGQAGFSDVPVGHPFHDEIAWLVAEGITTGFPDDTFRPTQPVTRQAAAAFLYRFDGEPAVSGQAGFADVPEGHPFESEIAWLVGEGITTGFPDDTFRPVNDVTRQAMAAFLYRYGGGVEVIAIAQCINLEPVIVVSAVTGEIDGVPVFGALPEGTYTLTGDLDVTLTHEELNVGVLVEPRAYEFTISGDAIRSAQLQADLSECVATA